MGAAGAGQPEIVRTCLARIDQPRGAWYWYNMMREPLYIGMRRNKREREAMIRMLPLLLERAGPERAR
jgi:hypothetical protein